MQHQVERFLRERYGADVSGVEPVAHGEWSKAFFYHVACRDFVVRFSAFEDDFRKDERVMPYATSRLPIPRLLDIGQAFDGFYAVSQRATGDFLEQRSAEDMQRLLPSLFDMLDAARETAVPESVGAGQWRGSDGCAPHRTWRDALLAIANDPPSTRTHGWRERLSRFPESMRAFEAGYQQVQELLDACPNQHHLVHSDLLNFNVLVGDDRIGAVLDWGSSMYGDFLWDLAWITFWQPWYAAWAAVDIRAAAVQHFETAGLSVPQFAERMRCYELAIGLDGMAYQAFDDHADDLAWTTRRVLELLASVGGRGRSPSARHPTRTSFRG
jgi:hygromycin-B 4-O-kinase